MDNQTASIIEIVLGLMAAAVPLAIVARRFGLPYPVMLVLGGLLIGFTPGIPNVSLNPSLVFSLFLPPVLYQAALMTSWRDFKLNSRSILLLAIGLVTFTTLAFGYATHEFIHALPLASAFLLGAIISPTDAAAATTVMQKLSLPRRIVTIVEGESLVNDATGLVAFTVALGAVSTGMVSWSFAAGQFFWLIVCGIGVGYIFGRTSVFVHSLLKDGSLEVLLSLILPFLTYLVTESLHGSGVLAVVCAGLIQGRHASRSLSPPQRIILLSLWDMIVFLVNTLAFILIGMQLKTILHNLAGYTTPDLIRYGLVAALSAIIIRMIWVFPGAYLPRYFSRKIRARDPYPSWQSVVIVGWSGMRGVVSLAAALSLPQETSYGSAFPGRDLVIYLAFCVILGTLVFQGLSLGWLIEKLNVGKDTQGPAEEKLARREAAQAAVSFLGRLTEHKVFPAEILEEVSGEYLQRIEDLDCTDRPDNAENLTATTETRRRVRLEAIAAQREKIQELRYNGVIGDDVLHKIERKLDFHEAGLL